MIPRVYFLVTTDIGHWKHIGHWTYMPFRYHSTYMLFFSNLHDTSSIPDSSVVYVILAEEFSVVSVKMWRFSNSNTPPSNTAHLHLITSKYLCYFSIDLTTPDRIGVYSQYQFSKVAVYAERRLQIYCRYTAYAAVELQHTLHGTAGTLHLGLGTLGGLTKSHAVYSG